jgi:hypothetical protein
MSKICNGAKKLILDIHINVPAPPYKEEKKIVIRMTDY